MTIPDWSGLLSEFKESMVSRKLYCHNYYLGARRLVWFLEAGSRTHLDEEILRSWIQERLRLCTLGYLLSELNQITNFVRFLEEKGLCPRGLLAKMRKCCNLLLQLQGPRHYSARGFHLEEHWQGIMITFEATLRGYTPHNISCILRVASEFAFLLQQKNTTTPDRETFLEWLDEKLSQSIRIKNVRRHMAHLNRFCQFLMERGTSTSNPVREWCFCQPSYFEALTRRREGKPPIFRPSKFQSFLASKIMAFIDHKRSLGCKYRDVLTLEYFDRYLRKHTVDSWRKVNEALLFDFWGTLSYWKASPRKKAMRQLQQFFHFLERQGEITSQQNPARFLPRVVCPPYIPYIFTLKEIVAILSYIRENSGRCDFDGNMLFTLFHLIYACGLRISEAIRLQVGDVNLQERTLFIGKTKFGKSRLIPFCYRVAEYLSVYYASRLERLGEPGISAPFFVGSIGKPYSRDSLDGIFHQACQRTKVGQHLDQTPRVHDLRHSFAVHRLYKWYQEGADPQEKLILLSIYMGHTHTKHTQHYLHISEDLMRIAGNPLSRSLDEWIKERQVLNFDE